MSDTFAPMAAPEVSTSELAAPQSELTGGSSLIAEFNPAQIDKNIRAIESVEASWRQPALDDEVRFDLANLPGMNEIGIREFLIGMDEDMSDEPPEGFDRPQYDPSVPMPDQTGLQQAQIILAGIASNPPPTEVDGNAVAKWKQRAIEAGYLDQDMARTDNTWSPEMNRIYQQMKWDEVQEAQAGDRYGAVSVNTVVDFIDKFTSPGNLLAAATELDLWWDFGAIGDEFSSWGDKWRKVSKSKNPFDLAGNLIDAITGPLDDILIPALNIGLTAMGIGGLWNAGRAGFLGANLARTGSTFGGLFRAGSMARQAKNLDNLAEASWLAQRWAGKGTLRAAYSTASKAWSGSKPIIATRRTLQAPFRAGVLSQVEDYLPGYQGGLDLREFDIVDDADNFLESTSSNPLYLPAEVLLAPYNIFTPGTFMKAADVTGDALDLLGQARRATALGLSTAGGRAAIGAIAGVVGGTAAGDDVGDIATGAAIGAIGGAALPLVGKGLSTQLGGAVGTVAAGATAGAVLGDDPSDAILGAIAGIGLVAFPSTARDSFLASLGSGAISRIIRKGGAAAAHLDYKPIGNHHIPTLGFDSSMRRYLGGFQDGGEALKDWEDRVASTSVLQALADTHMEGDVDKAGSALGFLYMSAISEFVAKAQAGGRGDLLSDAATWDRYQMNRNKLINQIRRFDLDNPTEGTIHELADALAWTEKGGRGDLAEVYRTRDAYREEMLANPARALELAADHDRKAIKTIEGLLDPDNAPDLDEVDPFLEGASALDNLVHPELQRESVRSRAWIMQEYLSDDVMDTLGNWPKFIENTEAIRDLRLQGIFEPATLKPYLSRQGTLRSVRSKKFLRGKRTSRSVQDATSAIQQRVLRDLKIDKIDQSQVSPLAGAHNPGRVTVARKETMVEQQYREAAEEVKDFLEASEDWGLLRQTLGPSWREVEGLPDAVSSDARQLLAAEGITDATPLSEFEKKRLHAVIDRAFPVGGKTRKQRAPGVKARSAAHRLLEFAARHELSIGDLDEFITTHVDELAADIDKWDQFGLPVRLLDEEANKPIHGVDALVRRYEQLNEKARRTAAEVDVDGLVQTLRSNDRTAQADELAAFAAKMDEDGYKLVHGVEFLMPEDMAFGALFEDATQRHLHAATIGNFFRGKLPIEGHIVQDRNRRLQLAVALSEQSGKKVSPDDAIVTQALFDLRRFLQNTQEVNTAALRDADRGSMGEKFTTRLKSNFVPFSIDDIGRSRKKLVEKLFELGYDEDQAHAIWRASKNFRNSDFKDVGLYGLESKLRTMNVAEAGLKSLAGTKYGENLAARTLKGQGGFAAAGFSAGVVNESNEDPNASFEDKLLAGLQGAGIGLGAGVVSRLAGNALNSSLDAGRWGWAYLPDHYARMRDALRFTLSPIFDASRYTEGALLAQTAVPTHLPDGTRLQMPADMSPAGWRRRYRKALGEKEKGLSKTELNSRANHAYDARMRQFQDQAKGDFDPEILDSTDKWFKQVGILGFSPTDWMATMFAELVDKGFEGRDAYRAAREAYTYGMTGRSAAEMSVNFVFFPFSFQKKALGHIAQWMNTDLGRSLVVHDMVKTYQILDEKYNLDQFWEDHIPALEALRKLNLFAYGISPGRLGGMNAQLIEGFGQLTHGAAAALFQPIGVNIRGPEDFQAIKDVIGQLAPAINDVETLRDKVLVDQFKNVIGGGIASQFGAPGDGWLSKQGQIDRGYKELTELRESFQTELDRLGYTWADFTNKEWMAPRYEQYKMLEAQLGVRFPEWKAFRDEYTEKLIHLQMERRQRTERALTPNASQSDLDMLEMETLLDQERDTLRLVTGSTDLKNAGPVVYQRIRQRGAELAERNPSFEYLWDRFYRREFGPISYVLEIEGGFGGVV